MTTCLLFRPTPPLPDESLSGALARAAGANIYEKTSDIMALVDRGTALADFVAFNSPDILPHIALLLGVDEARVARHHHRWLDKLTVDFFGVPVREIFIDRSRRWVSPAGLRTSPYHRAVWQITTFGFDPVTLDPLICTCPRCGHELGFRISQGIAFCDRCREPNGKGFEDPSVDLRSIKQNPVKVEDRAGLDFVTSLLDPGQPVLGLGSLHPEVADLSHGELFEVAHAIAAALKMNADGIPVAATFSRSAIGTLPATLLARAGRAIIDWPKGFESMCDQEGATSSDRVGEWGLKKAFGWLCKVPFDRYLSDSIRTPMKSAMQASLTDGLRRYGVGAKGANRPDGYLPLRAIKDRYADSQPTLSKIVEHPRTKRVRIGNSVKAPVYLHANQTRMTLIQFDDQIPLSTVVLELGIPPNSVHDLVQRRRMFVYAGTSVEVAASGTYLSKTGLSKLKSNLMEGRRLEEIAPECTKFLDLMYRFPPASRPWVPLLERLLDRRLEYQLFAPLSRSLVKSIAVRNAAQVLPELAAEQAALPQAPVSRMTSSATATFLGIYYTPVMQALAEARALVPRDGMLDYDDVLAFADRHILMNEIAARTDHGPRAARAWLDECGAVPAFDFAMKTGTIYFRDEIEQLLGDRPTGPRI